MKTSKSKTNGASGAEKGESLEQALSALKAAKLKQTQPRIALLKLLIERHGPYSTEEIHGMLKGQQMDLVTVYRCLSAFEKIGLVRRCDFGDGVARYEYEGDASHHHHHVICRSCRKMESLDACVAERFQKVVEKMGFDQVTHNMEFFGLCPDCRGEK